MRTNVCNSYVQGRTLLLVSQCLPACFWRVFATMVSSERGRQRKSAFKVTGQQVHMQAGAGSGQHISSGTESSLHNIVKNI